MADVFTNLVRMTYGCVFCRKQTYKYDDDDDEEEYSPTLCQLLKVLGSL